MAIGISAGIRFFQYRSKNGTRKSIYENSLKLSSLSHRSNVLFVVNDHADIAAAVEADGVHLGQDDLPIQFARKLLGGEKIIGISTHNRSQAQAAQAAGADYIGFGPIFPTATKDAGVALGCSALSDVMQSVSIPVIAIGGITSYNILEVMKAGASGAAVITSILSAPDPEFAAKTMLKIIEQRKA
jgi:thiamine-phosphate pyrophosphorylase